MGSGSSKRDDARESVVSRSYTSAHEPVRFHDRCHQFTNITEGGTRAETRSHLPLHGTVTFSAVPVNELHTRRYNFKVQRWVS